MEWSELIAGDDCAIAIRGTAGNVQAVQDTVTRVRFAQVATAGCKDGVCREVPKADQRIIYRGSRVRSRS